MNNVKSEPKEKDIQMLKDGIVNIFSTAADAFVSIAASFDKESFLENIRTGLDEVPEEMIRRAINENRDPSKRFQVTLPLSHYLYYQEHAEYQRRSMSEFVDYACKRHCAQNPLPREKQKKGKSIPKT